MKKIIPIIMILAGILLVLSFFVLQPKQKVKYFTDGPETWLDKDYSTDKLDDIEINIYKATGGKSIVDISQQDYYLNNDVITLFYEGLYKGNMFETAYLDPLFYEISENKTKQEQIELAKKHLLMRINPKLDPNDGIINSFALLKQENNQFVIYIFLDQDWVDNVPYTNIIWGSNFNKPAKLNTQSFDFSKSQDGIYIEKIQDDLNWIRASPNYGGLIVGEITKEILADKEQRETINITYMMLR